MPSLYAWKCHKDFNENCQLNKARRYPMAFFAIFLIIFIYLFILKFIVTRCIEISILKKGSPCPCFRGIGYMPYGKAKFRHQFSKTYNENKKLLN